MDGIYITYALDDGDAVGPLAEMLRGAGYSVCFGPLIPPGLNQREQIQAEIKRAHVVLAIWSSHATGSARVREDAAFAAEWGNLVSVRIDAAAIPSFSGAVVDLSEVENLASGEGARAILAAISLAPAMPEASPAGPGAAPGAGSGLAAGLPARLDRQSLMRLERRPADWRGLVVVSALALTAMVGLGLAMLASPAVQGQGGFEGGTLGGSDAGGAMPLDPAIPSEAHEDASAGGTGTASRPFSGGAGEAAGPEEAQALEQWGGVARDDPGALRGFLARHGGGALGDEARGILARLERSVWGELNTRRDAAGILKGLEAYRADFPDGLFAAEAGAIERRERGRIAEAQGLLRAIGLSRAEPDGILKDDTLVAIRTFQASLSLPATGLVDAGLMQALRAAEGGRGEGAAGTGARIAAGAGAAPAALSRPDARPSPGPDKSPEPAPASKAVAGALPGAALSPDMRPGAPFRDCYACPELVLLPAGAFTMGDVTGRAPSDERPARRVSISYRLAIGRYEVTFEEWDACVADGDCRYRPDDRGLGRGARPVSDVSPADIAGYLTWLGRKTGKRYRLPSEAEWEYAARAGGVSAWSSGNDPGVLCSFANGADASSSYAWRNSACSDRFATGPAPVGSFRPNAFGLYDMMGNVWEWVGDCWHPGYEGAPVDGSAWTTGCEGPDRVLRGGAYSVEIDKLRVSFRYHFAPKRMPFFGFRVARVLE